jgi:hypothetical protein
VNDSSADHQPKPGRYEIRLKGHLAAQWAAWFDGMTMTTHSDGTTVLEGPVVDQAALHGLLTKLRDLGLPLLSLTQVDADPPTPPRIPPDTSSSAWHSTPQGD